MISCNMGDKSENPLITKVVSHAGTKSVTFTTGTRVRCCTLIYWPITRQRLRGSS
jgi:hypothetical protein